MSKPLQQLREEIEKAATEREAKISTTLASLTIALARLRLQLEDQQ